MSAGITVVGDGIVDIISTGRLPGVNHGGGAALNVAKGLAILGVPASLVFNSADDELGEWLTAHLLSHHVRPIRLAAPHGTGIARAHFETAESEPRYTFNDAVLRREYTISREASAALADSAAIVLTAFPLDHASSVREFVDAVRATGARLVVDPNPRESLLSSVAAYRRGFETVAAISDLVKLSDEDVGLLYGAENPIPRLLAQGAVVVLTHGAGGATVHVPDNAPIHAPAHSLGTPVVDTLGAGDATLATVIAETVPARDWTDPTVWASALERAMENAAWTCRAAGGTLQLPERRLTEKESRHA